MVCKFLLRFSLTLIKFSSLQIRHHRHTKTSMRPLPILFYEGTIVQEESLPTILCHSLHWIKCETALSHYVPHAGCRVIHETSKMKDTAFHLCPIKMQYFTKQFCIFHCGHRTQKILNVPIPIFCQISQTIQRSIRFPLRQINKTKTVLTKNGFYFIQILPDTLVQTIVITIFYINVSVRIKIKRNFPRIMKLLELIPFPPIVFLPFLLLS